MPGDVINIMDGHIQKAKKIFSVLYKIINNYLTEEPEKKIIISICGGSGVGKSGIASVLSYILTDIGLASYTLSGDNYPKRIPSANDNERLHIFRHGGVKKLASMNILTPEILKVLKELQLENNDADKNLCGIYPWFSYYLEGGTSALKNYIGTPLELDFDELNEILSGFKQGKEEIWLKRMGRDEASLWYDKVLMKDTKILILEWTHANSDYLMGIDIPILLESTPEETLEYRLLRGRDKKIDTPFTTLILEIEQELLNSQADKAKIIMIKSGRITKP
ncbi:MAG: adenylyl-sulfate kinase [Lachnospiraceae bacterium]|nr:adenylyl-sulfate kinase [Lachnospiraceae bacterium]